MKEDAKYYQSKEFKALLAQYEQMVADGRKIYMDADDLCDIAEFYNLHEAPAEQVQSVVDYALQLHPDCSTALALKARLALERDDLEQAMLITDSIPDQFDREVYYIRAEVLLCQDRADDAFNYLYELRDTVPEELDYYLYESGKLFMDYNDVAHAAVFASELYSYAPEWYNSWDLMSSVLLAHDNFTDALPFVERMLDADPFDCDVWCMAAEAYSCAKLYDKSMEASENALAIDPECYRAMQFKAYCLYITERTSEALALYETLTKDNNATAYDYLFMSYCYYEQERYLESLRAVMQAMMIADDKDNNQLPVLLKRSLHEQHSIVASAMGNVADALYAMDALESLDGLPELDAGHWPPDMYRARVYAENNQPETAIHYIMSVADHFAEQSDFYLAVGAEFMYDFSYTSEVLQLLDSIHTDRLEPSQQHNYYGMKAGCLHRLKQYEQAWNAIGEAIANGTTEISSYFDGFLPDDTPDADAQDYYYILVGGK